MSTRQRKVVGGRWRLGRVESRRRASIEAHSSGEHEGRGKEGIGKRALKGPKMSKKDGVLGCLPEPASVVEPALELFVRACVPETEPGREAAAAAVAGVVVVAGLE